MGTTIKVVVSKGIEQAIVPKVVGMTEDEAIKALEEAKLKVQKVEEENKKIEAGYVISQETEPESKVLAGDTVVIHVSTGVKKVAVPSVIGKSEEEATKTLSDLGLSVKTVNDEDSSKDNGIRRKGRGAASPRPSSGGRAACRTATSCCGIHTGCRTIPILIL